MHEHENPSMDDDTVVELVLRPTVTVCADAGDPLTRARDVRGELLDLIRGAQDSVEDVLGAILGPAGGSGHSMSTTQIAILLYLDAAQRALYSAALTVRTDQ